MSSFNLSNDDFEVFKNLIYKESGICFNAINRTVLESRLGSVLYNYKISDLSELYKLISSNRQVMNEFLDNVTTNLTKFFRIQKHFEVLQSYVLPQIMKDKAQKGLKNISIWSAGCSTGEEAYSIAISCLQTPNASKFNIRIYANDISLKSLIKAKDGIYNSSIVSSVPEDYLVRYFDKFDNGMYVVKKEVKSMITFDYHNLTHNFTRSGFDIIFCRNTLIYFDAAAQKASILKFYKLLDSKGYLFIGHSESLFGMDTKFEYRNINDAVFYIKE